MKNETKTEAKSKPKKSGARGGRNKQRANGEDRAGFMIYLTPDEKALLATASEMDGLDLSVYIRHAALLKAKVETLQRGA